MSIKRWTLSIAVLLASLSQGMAQDAQWTVVGGQPLETVIGEGYEPYQATLSPDGSVVGWWDNQKDQICVYHFAEAETTCYESAENMLPFGPYSYPSWSPDGRSLAFTESFFDRLVDSDVWVLDTQSGKISNLTDDQVFDNLLDLDEDEAVPVDYLPSWNPITGDLLFFRSSRVEGIWTTGLYRLTNDGTDPELVIDLSTSVPTLSIFRRGAISPDGQQMAVGVIGQDPGDPLNGIYLIDLTEGTLTKVAALDDMKTGWPDWAKEEAHPFPTMIGWAGDDALVITSVDDRMATTLGVNTVSLDLTSGNVTPLIDFTQVADKSDFLKTDGPGSQLLRIGVVAPDGKSLWGLRYTVNDETTNVVVLPLPPDGHVDANVETRDVAGFRIMPRTMYETSVSADGKMLLFGWLFTLEH